MATTPRPARALDGRRMTELVVVVPAFVRGLRSIVRQIRDSSIGHWIDRRNAVGEQLRPHASGFPGAVAKVASGALGIGSSTFDPVLGAVASPPRRFYATPAGWRRWRRPSGSATTTVADTAVLRLRLAALRAGAATADGL